MLYKKMFNTKDSSEGGTKHEHKKHTVKRGLRTNTKKRHVEANSKMVHLSPVIWTVTLNVLE